MIRLYGIRQSRALRSLWALEELEVPYEHVQTNFQTDAMQPEYLAINPNGRIPAPVDGDVTLFESMAINLYLARKYDKRGRWPKTAADEALAAAGEEKLVAPLRVLDGALAGNKYLLGDAFTIADLNVASVLAWALFAKLDLSTTPNVARWLDECCGRPAFAKAQRG